MRIPESKIAEISAAADIVRVISEYVDLKKAGKDFRGVCPFHGDKDPSFYVSPQKGIFHCFGCAVGGSVFNFIMKAENVSFVEAVQVLARKYGIALDFEKSAFGSTGDRKQKYFDALVHAQSFFVSSLGSAPEVCKYLENRGVSYEDAERVGLGFAPDTWEGLTNHLRKVGVDFRDAASVGLVRERSGSGFYDYFRSRLMIPIKDLTGKIIGFGGRIIGAGEPKYLNSPESPIFQKKSILFGLDAAREGIKKEECAILVEGYFDQISLRLRGLENSVAPLGTALSVDQVRLLKRFTSNIVVLFDGDEAGIRAVKRSIPIFLSQGIEPKCLILFQDKDPDEAVRRLGAAGFRSLLSNAKSIIDFLFEHLAEQHDLTRLQGRNSALEECIPVLREIADSSDRDYLIERFSSRLKIREDRLRKLVQTQVSLTKKTDRIQVRSLFDFPADERNVVRGMLLKPGFMEEVLESGVLKYINHPTLKELSALMLHFKDENGAFDAPAFAGSLSSEELASIVAGFLKPRPEEDDLRPEVDGDKVMYESLENLRLKRLENRKAEIQELMKKCTPCNDEYNELARELWAIGRRLRK